MRCKACNTIMTTEELVVHEETGELDDLCTVCRKASRDEHDELVEAAFIRSRRKFPMEGDEWDD